MNLPNRDSVQVVTYISPSGATIDVCQACSTLNPWPKDSRGQEYARVSHGLHVGGCSICGAGLPSWERTEKEKPAVIRLPPTEMSRKNAYLRAANGQPLTEWIWEQCDKAAGYEQKRIQAVNERRRKAK